MKDRIRRFCEEYMRNGNNGTQAWMAISPTASANSAKVTACNLLKKPEVREYMEARLKEAAMSTDECLARLARQARGTMGKFINVDPATGRPLLNMADVDDDDLSLISKFQEQEVPVGKDGSTKRITTLELYSSQEALRTIAKTLGLLDDVSQAQFQKQVDALMELLRTHLDADTFSKVIKVVAMGMSSPSVAAANKKQKARK